MGALMVTITELTSPHRLVRPFLGVGVLGGYTTFSTYSVDIQQMLAASRPGLALTYLVLTPLAALAAVWAGANIIRLLAKRKDDRP
jgi:CrcB protein